MIFLTTLASLYLLILAVCFITLLTGERKSPEPAEWPSISVWVAARNEEAHILACLQHLDALDYPKNKLQILVGNDHSEDNTAAIAASFIKDKPWFQLIQIGENLGKAKKKANVLAQLAHQSTGEIYLLCDADMEPKTTWAKSLVSSFDPGTGVISSTTYIKPINLFAALQGLDWLYFLGMIKGFATLGIPCTAVGNNMAVRKKAYWDCGGYENIDFSITEDFKLFKEIIAKGWGWKQLLNKETLSVSEPAPDMKALMRQRKRWLTGGKELFWYWKILVLIFGAFIPVLLVILVINPMLALEIWLAKAVLQAVVFIPLIRRTGIRPSVLSLCLYEFYSLFLSFATPLYFFAPGGKNWKGRNFLV